jgi:WD40 repeat protein
MSAASANARRKSWAGMVNAPMDAAVEVGEHPISRGGIKVKEAVIVQENNETVYSVNYSSDAKWLAASYGNSTIRIFNTAGSTGYLPTQRLRAQASNTDGLPTTSVKWRPNAPTSAYELASACTDGSVHLWKWVDPSDTNAFVEHTARCAEEGNETMCIDYSPDGTLLASCGSDKTLRVYDTTSAQLKQAMNRGVDEHGHSRGAHSNRVFSCKFATNMTVLSAGWENPVQVWDLRTGRSERQLGGAHVCSDSIELIPGTTQCIVASLRNHDQIKVFDFLSARELTTESERLSQALGKSQVYAVRDAGRGLLAVLGTKPNVVQLLDFATGTVKGSIENLAKSFFCLAAQPKQKDSPVGGPTSFAAGGFEETILVLEC